MKRQLGIILSLMAVGLLAIPEASARTIPIRGAVSKPGRLKIRAPFPCGVPIRITCAYGTSCSPAHKRVKAQGSTNDYYAVDMARRAPDNGFDMPVVAVAAGIVRYAGWTKRGWSPYGKVVYIEHLFKDRHGKRYQTMYAHLHQVMVVKGQRVEAGTVIGTLGGSSKHRSRKLGAHLHFAMYRGAKRTIGGGNAVVPEPMGAQEDLRPRMSWIACDKVQRRPVARRGSGRKPTAFGGLTDSK